jgi:hypothetical protein
MAAASFPMLTLEPGFPAAVCWYGAVQDGMILKLMSDAAFQTVIPARSEMLYLVGLDSGSELLL